MELEVNNNGKVVKFDPDIDSELDIEEWMTYRCFLSTQKGVRDMQEGIEEVRTTSLALSILLCLPVSTASVERSFSAMKTIKTRLRNRLMYRFKPRKFNKNS